MNLTTNYEEFISLKSYHLLMMVIKKCDTTDTTLKNKPYMQNVT